MDITYYVTYDLPVPYKNIELYPVTVKDYLLFNVYAQCLNMDKNSIPDPNIISMTDLEYIFYLLDKDLEKPYLLWFDRLLSLCLKDESFKEIEKSISRFNYDDETKKPFFTIKEDKYNSEDFEKMKEIIAKQNLVELIDENISKEVRDSLEKAKEYKRKISGIKPASFEDYIISLSTVTGWTFDYIYSMTIRKFLKSIRRLDNFIHYKIYLSASMSGMVEFKDKSFIIHWLSSIDDEDIYNDVSIDLEEIQEKVSFESAKK
jgi:hypothetical protein